MDQKRRAPDTLVDSYIVRIYRFDGKRRGGVVGIVETVGEDVQTAFTNVDDLWNILNSENHRKGGAKRSDCDMDWKRQRWGCFYPRRGGWVSIIKI